MTLLKKAKKRRNSKSDIVFICVMLSVPVLHFALFWLYINIDTIFLSFQKFELNTGEWVWFGFGKLDGLTMWRELFSVTIPMIGSTLGTLLLLGTTTIFTYFLQPKLLLGTNAENVGGYTIALYIVNNVRDAGTPQMALGATMGILCAAVGTPIVFGSRKLIDRFLPAYEY